MTEKQRDYIKRLDQKLEKLGSSICSNDFLGDDWNEFYKNITPTAASEVIEALLEEIKYGKE